MIYKKILNSIPCKKILQYFNYTPSDSEGKDEIYLIAYLLVKNKMFVMIIILWLSSVPFAENKEEWLESE